MEETSNLIVGVQANAAVARDDFLGESDDQAIASGSEKITSSVASITIKRLGVWHPADQLGEKLRHLRLPRPTDRLIQGRRHELPAHRWCSQRSRRRHGRSASSRGGHLTATGRPRRCEFRCSQKAALRSKLWPSRRAPPPPHSHEHRTPRNPHRSRLVFTFTDVDGDKITITNSANGMIVPTFATFGGGHSCRCSISRTLPTRARISRPPWSKAPAGDGLVNIGRIDATGRDLGSVTIKGDLGAIDAGDATTTTAGLKLLSVRSIGRFALATQGGHGRPREQHHGRARRAQGRGRCPRALIDVNGGLRTERSARSASAARSSAGGFSRRAISAR